MLGIARPIYISEASRVQLITGRARLEPFATPTTVLIRRQYVWAHASTPTRW